MRQQPTRLLVAPDIYGATPELARLVRALGIGATILSPHPHNAAFRSEAEAYSAFQATGGVEAYARQLGLLMSSHSAPFEAALGFSAGASALWLCMADARIEPRLPKRAILYYGSRIRDHARLQPRRFLQLVFAEREASFDPAPLATELRGGGTCARVLPGTAHGFMNPLSPGYDEAVCAAEIMRLRGLLGTSEAPPGAFGRGRSRRASGGRADVRGAPEPMIVRSFLPLESLLARAQRDDPEPRGLLGS